MEFELYSSSGPPNRMLKKPITTDYVNVHGDVNKNGTRIDADLRGKKAENPRKSPFIRVQIGFSLLLGKRHKLELHMVKLRDSVFQHPARGRTLH